MLITVEAMARHGDTDKAIYEKLGISHQTFYRWLNKHGEFCEAYKRGKASTDAQINLICESALERLIIGCEYKEKRTELIANPSDPQNPKIQKQIITTKKIMPNLGAIIWWQKNRDGLRWIDGNYQEQQQFGDKRVIGFDFVEISESEIKAQAKLYKHQAQFVNTAHLYPALVGGYGSGKTFSGIRRFLKLAEMRNKQGIKDPLFFYGAPTRELIDTIFLLELEETLQGYGIPYKHDQKGHIFYVYSKDFPFRIKLLTLDKDNWRRIIGFEATDGWLDEFDILPIKHQPEIWRKCIGRLRKCDKATLAITTTPEGHKYVYQLHEEKKIELITASSDDNKSLPQSYLDELEANYDEQHIKMYKHGEFVNLAGMQAIYQFKRSRLIDPLNYDDLPENLTVGIDFNVDPFCLTVSAMIDGVKITFDCFYIRNLAGAGSYESYTDKAMNILLAKYPNQFYNENYLDKNAKRVFKLEARPDMTGGARKTSARTTDLKIIRKYMLTIKGTYNPLVSERLNVANISMAKEQWKITSNCTELIKDLEYVVTDQYGELVKDDSGQGRYRGHLLDAVTYDVYHEFKHIYGHRPTVTARGL